MFAQWRQRKCLQQTYDAWCLPLLASVGTEEQLKRAKTTVWMLATPDQGVIVGVIQHSATL